MPLANIVEGSLNKVLSRKDDFSMSELHFKLEAFVTKYSVDEGYSGRVDGLQRMLVTLQAVGGGNVR